ncbi:MAG: tyrosine-type recombinase/integrase [Acidiferrobacteraceae bacterium]
MATITRRGQYQWRARVRRRGQVVSKTFETREAAETWAAGTEGEIRQGLHASRVEAESTTLTEVLDRYEREVSPQKKSGPDEHYKLNVWRETILAGHVLASIQGKDLAAWRDSEIRRGCASGTVRRNLALLSHVFEVARKEWGMTSLVNPTTAIRLPPPGQARTRRLVDDEEARLLEAAKTYGGEIGRVIPWAIETAMRRGEIAAMRWEHLDRKARVLLIPETKTGTPRRVPLSTRALQVLEGLPRRLDGKVWGMRPDSISQAFERVCTAAGVEGLTFHDLRHEATSRLFEKGLNPMQVAAITGHKTLQMLKRYTHLRAEDLVGMLG